MVGQTTNSQSEGNGLLSDVAQYYSSKLTEFGETPNGVDWNGTESQWLRFQQLSKIIEPADRFSITDLGCGYGAYYDYLSSRYADFAYHGCDVSADMVQAAQKRYADRRNVQFDWGSEPSVATDYATASGIFNVRLKHGDVEWLEYIHATLDVLHRHGSRGFSFNCLTSYSDADKMRGHLYYADPLALFDHCKRRYSRHVALLHDYGLYEFTILVRKFE